MRCPLSAPPLQELPCGARELLMEAWCQPAHAPKQAVTSNSALYSMSNTAPAHVQRMRTQRRALS